MDSSFKKAPLIHVLKKISRNRFKHYNINGIFFYYYISLRLKYTKPININYPAVWSDGAFIYLYNFIQKAISLLPSLNELIITCNEYLKQFHLQ